MERIFGYARLLASGAPAPGATVHAYASGTLSHVPIYQDNNSPPTPLANPVTCDSNGFFFFYTPNALIELQFSGGGIPTPYALAAWAAGGIGDGGLLPVSSSSFPAVASQHRGRLRLLGDSTLGPPGVWVQDQAAWQPALDYAFRSYARAALPAAPQAGMVRRLADGPQGLVIAHSGGWEPAMSFGFDPILKASLPTPGIRARLRQVTDGPRGLWADQLAQWYSLSHEWADVREFGATGNGSTDDTAAIQAALDTVPDVLEAQGGGGVVVFPPAASNYRTTAPLRVKNGTTIIGWGAVVRAQGIDCAFRAAVRDDNLLTTFGRCRVLGLTVSAGTSTPNFSAFDLTGMIESIFLGVRVLGFIAPPLAPVGQSAFRLANLNPAGTSSKLCQGNLIIGCQVTKLDTFLVAAQTIADRVASNTLMQIHAEDITRGFDLGGVTLGGLHLLCFGGRLIGVGVATAGTAQAITSPTVPPSGLTFVGVHASNFGDGNGALVAATLFKEDLAIGASGTLSTSPLSPSGVTPETFSGSVYLRIPAGTIVPAGASTYSYTLTGAPTGASFLVSPVSGLPAASPLGYQGVLSGSALTLTVISGANLTLVSDLVLRAVQVGP